jgi:hypothetical protein
VKHITQALKKKAKRKERHQIFQGKNKKKENRGRQDSNLRGQSPHDF